MITNKPVVPDFFRRGSLLSVVITDTARGGLPFRPRLPSLRSVLTLCSERAYPLFRARPEQRRCVPCCNVLVLSALSFACSLSVEARLTDRRGGARAGESVRMCLQAEKKNADISSGSRFLRIKLFGSGRWAETSVRRQRKEGGKMPPLYLIYMADKGEKTAEGKTLKDVICISKNKIRVINLCHFSLILSRFS